MAAARKLAVLRGRLKGYVDPSTASDFEGYIEPGTYAVLEERLNYPTDETDYIRVDAPLLGAGDTWLCARWRSNRYATITDHGSGSAPRDPRVDDERAIEERHLTQLLPAFEPYTYEPDLARYPWPLPGFKAPLAPPAVNNCCTFVEALLVKAFADALGDDFIWGTRRHRQMMISSDEDYFSPVSAAVKSGMGIAVEEADSPPVPWTLVQGWRRQWRGGHSFLAVDHHEPTGKVLVLESNSAYRLNGVGLRGLGNLRELESRVPEAWWESPEVWTWQRVCSTYRYRQQARLRVKDLQWASR